MNDPGSIIVQEDAITQPRTQGNREAMFLLAEKYSAVVGSQQTSKFNSRASMID